MINAAGKKTNHTIYHKGKGSLGIDNYTLYMADHISWRNVSLMPGVRYDYDNYLSNHNISPRFMTEWDIFADQTSMITAGYNRYYGGNILDMGLRDIRNSWTESVSGNKTLTRYQNLKTPYNDELAMGLQQKSVRTLLHAQTMFTVKRMIKSAKAVVPTARLKPPLLNITTMAKPKRIRSASVLNWPNPCISAR